MKKNELCALLSALFLSILGIMLLVRLQVATPLLAQINFSYEASHAPKATPMTLSRSIQGGKSYTISVVQTTYSQDLICEIQELDQYEMIISTISETVSRDELITHLLTKDQTKAIRVKVLTPTTSNVEVVITLL